MPPPSRPLRAIRTWGAVIAPACVVTAAWAQQPSTPADTPAPAPAPAKLDRVEITGGRADDVQERRESTAAKIVIGRDEIERFGDSTLGEVLKRLPGVTIQGRPGRGGQIRMRGLGNGYTQILLDGERVPPGFSIDAIDPEEIERIEIYRAPTAETGARAIAGTINIVTRNGYTKRVNDLKVGASFENGRLQPGVSWTHNDTAGRWIYNTSLSAFRTNRASDTRVTTVDERLSDGTVLLAQREDGTVREQRNGLHATGRLQWRGDEPGHLVTITPLFLWSAGPSHRTGAVTQSVPPVPASGCLSSGIGAPVDECQADHSTTDSHGDYRLMRLNGQWNRRLAEALRTEVRLGGSDGHWQGHSLRLETTNGALSRTLQDDTDNHDRGVTASAKLIALVAGDHSLVSGIELESNRRNDAHTTLQDGAPLLVEFGDNASATSNRYALYTQDEWGFGTHWSLHAGLRWEDIETRGSREVGDGDVTNRSRVWTPLLHAVWKPDPKGRDQVRMSLTRSYRSPPLGNLIARPSINVRNPVPGPNTPTQPDRAGNPDLKPELATGLDLAVERYLPGSGILSANVFYRRIRDFMRSVVSLETVSWAAVPRWVSRPQNVGGATTAGIELEAKFRASDLWPEAPRLDVRANASAFRSRVNSVAGPDNRIDQQPDYTANLGGDYRFRGLPFTLGGNANWTPGYVTRISDQQTAIQGRKAVLDVYGLWTFSSASQLRVTASNVVPRDYITGSTFDEAGIREIATTLAPTSINLQVRLELKL